jgi:acyl-CoA thioesterase II
MPCCHRFPSLPVTSSDRLRAVFDLEQVAADEWHARPQDPRGGRMFGGTTIAQILAAARLSVTGPLRTSSVSVHFLLPTDARNSCGYHVERVHDGRSSATRRVTMVQEGQSVGLGTVAFRLHQQTWMHSGSRRPVIGPYQLHRTGMPHPARAIPPGAFDIRYYDDHENGTFVRRLWFRTIDRLPERPSIHECVVALISDLYFFEPIVAQHGLQGDDRSIRYATTQHTMWFHHPPSADQWLLLESRSPVGAGGRGLVSGEIRTAEGLVVATVLQEVAIRMSPNRNPVSLSGQ